MSTTNSRVKRVASERKATGTTKLRGKAASATVTKRRTQAERSEQMQLRLVQATAIVLRRKGYAGLRTEEVARAAAVSRGALLHHYPTKDHLVVATAAYLLRGGLERGAARAVTAKAVSDPIEAIIEDSMEFFLGDDFSVILDLVIASGKNNVLRNQVFSHARGSRLGVEDAWTQVLVERGISHEKAYKIVWITISIIRGFAVRTLWQKDENLFRSVLDEWKLILGDHLKKIKGKTA